ncbi:MAG TPA: exodeoxyribonuclease V subunit alpha [Propionibacteriaceae bacterium]|nr:exodeoxyribonuclease V subunit alpha [Propionibacteriaceae bacterium]
MTTTPYVSVAATGLLVPFAEAGVLDVADVQVARRVAHLYGEVSQVAVLGLALTVRALRLGAVCVVVDTVAEDVLATLEQQPADPLPWPSPVDWHDVLSTSALVTAGVEERGTRPLRWVDGRLYLERYWSDQELVRTELLRRATLPPPVVDRDRIERLADELSSDDALPAGAPNLQRLAAVTVARSWLTVLAGGPGTGKTTTVARALALVAAELGRPPVVALAAPSGRAAARLQESVRQVVERLPVGAADRAAIISARASTLHRLLGWQPGRRYLHNAENPLAADVVVVDELSMVPLSMMARLLPAVRSDARLVLVGDPEQLAPVEAGAVLADIAAAVEEPGAESAAPPLPLVRLRHTWRYQGAIEVLAQAIRDGDEDAAMDVLRGDDPAVRMVVLDGGGHVSAPDLARTRGACVDAGIRAVTAAREGDVDAALAALSTHRVLCAHRTGPYGAAAWGRQVGQWLAQAIPGYGSGGEWYVGRPLLVTRNDPDLGVSNGDAGIIVETARGPRAAFGTIPPLLLAPAQLEDVSTLHAMTVHKAQGSQFEQVTIVLPMLPSPLLTRELLYTAVTRASEQVTLIAHPDAVRQAIGTRALRASGLRSRLQAL